MNYKSSQSVTFFICQFLHFKDVPCP